MAHADRTQHGLHRGRQRVDMAHGDVVDALTRCDHRQLEWTQCRMDAQIRWQQSQRGVDSLRA